MQLNSLHERGPRTLPCVAVTPTTSIFGFPAEVFVYMRDCFCPSLVNYILVVSAIVVIVPSCLQSNWNK